MPFLALIDEQEIEFADAGVVLAAVCEGRLAPETWIKDADVEADWVTVEELLSSSPSAPE